MDAQSGLTRVVLVFIFLSASVASANNRDWKDAKVARIASSLNDEGVVVGTVGTTAVGGHIQSSTIYYWLETQDITYVVAVTYNPMRARFVQANGGHPLNVTLNGKTKIAVDGANVHILDDAGKDVKVPVVLKVARTPAESPK
jgi:hypothetical protein